MYRYIVLLGGRHTREAGKGSHIARALRDVGLHLRLTLGHIELYASGDTPVLSLPSRGALIGHVFSRDGNASIGTALLASRGDVAKRVISELWGEYLLLDAPNDGDPSDAKIMRDPSGGVDCVYSLSDGFVTSDISIATHAGLHTGTIDWDFIRRHLS